MANREQDRGEPAGARGTWREGRKWFLTMFLVLLLLAIAVVLYALKFRPMEFFYVLF